IQPQSDGLFLEFTGKNESTGGTKVSSGVTLDLTDDSILGSGSDAGASAKLSLDGGVVAVGGDGASSKSVTISEKRTLELGGSGASFSVGGTSASSASNALTIAAKIVGAGSVSKDGAGLLTLSNDNNLYTGGTDIKSGTIKVTDGVAASSGTVSSALGAGAVTVESGASLWVARDRAINISQPISGSGAIILSGTAVVQLTANNSNYTGAMTLNSGTLQVGENGTLGSGSLQNNALLLISRSGSLAVSAPINGTGKLKLDGSTLPSGSAAPQVSLSAQNDFTGETEITAATLKLDATSSISNSSVLRIQSGGTLDVTAFTNGYSISTGQSLQGNGGTIRGSVNVGGTLAPGNSPGSITVGGIKIDNTALFNAEIFQNVNASLDVADKILVNSALGGSGKIELSLASAGTLVSGTLSGVIGSTVVATAYGGRILHSGSYTILSGGTVNGTFSSVSGEFFKGWVDNDPALLAQLQARDPALFGGSLRSTGATAVLVPHLHYSADKVELEIERKTFKSLGLGVNAQELGNYLDSFVNAPGNLLALQVQLEAYQQASQVAAALAGASVSPYADLLSVSRRRVVDLGANVGSRLDLLGLSGARNGGVETQVGTGPEGWSVWQSNSVSELKRNAFTEKGFSGYTANGQSSVMGIERPMGGARVGLLGATGNTSANFNSPSTRISSDSWHLGGYASLPAAPFFADIAFIFGLVDNDARRNIEFPGYTARTRAKFDSTEHLLRLGGGYQIMPAQSAWEITPTEHLLYVGGVQAAFKESGTDVTGSSVANSLGARVAKAKNGGMLNEVGLTVGRRWVVRNVGVAVRLQSNWLHDFNGNGSIQAAFLGAPTGSGWFAARSAAAERNAFKLNGSLELSLTQRLSLRFSGEYEMRRHSDKGSLTISIGMEF
ncbi:MAG: autotransporter domain-containing protein, partial [Verrucomicrobiota bacterium]